MNPKDIKIKATTMCSPQYSHYNRNVKGKKKHYISVENNRIHTYKLVDGERVECNEGRCKVIKEEFYGALKRAVWQFDGVVYTHPRGILPEALKEFIRSAYAVKKERESFRRENNFSGCDHLSVCKESAEVWKKQDQDSWMLKGKSPDCPIYEYQSQSMRLGWILQNKLKKFSNPESQFDSLFSRPSNARTRMHPERAAAYLQIMNWFEGDEWPTRKNRRYVSGVNGDYARGHWEEIREAIPLCEKRGALWTEADTLEDSDYIYFIQSGTFNTLSHGDLLVRLYRDGTIEYLPRISVFGRGR